ALGIGLPILMEIAQRWILPDRGWTGWIFRLAGFLVPLLVLFYGLSLFYKLAPRRLTRFTEVWPAAAAVTLLIRLLEILFVIYLNNFARFNAIYGALGGVMALLVWIWLSGCLVVFGACLCAASAERAKPENAGPELAAGHADHHQPHQTRNAGPGG
ncbi:MAG TPA: YhjD/YihY/BrkB family envelope integrity protein, partial [Verrucomicrobiae bacterium]|nr:YhjD/YihY/BrkB family envelope integrity protein [Verrucomicrobiae bacterium]